MCTRYRRCRCRPAHCMCRDHYRDARYPHSRPASNQVPSTRSYRCTYPVPHRCHAHCTHLPQCPRIVWSTRDRANRTRRYKSRPSARTPRDCCMVFSPRLCKFHYSWSRNSPYHTGTPSPPAGTAHARYTNSQLPQDTPHHTPVRTIQPPFRFDVTIAEIAHLFRIGAGVAAQSHCCS